MNSSEFRQEFLSYFQKKGHKVVPSSSLLPTDPSVLLTTAGMQQFKEYFLDKPSPYGNRVVSCQKCFRTSDIEEVGDSTHLTFLEMLGNFSFGDYFKREAIEWAFELLTRNLEMPVKKLWFTYFEGDGEVPEDTRSKEIWQELGISRDRIVGCAREDNFWGPTGQEGPCGPTTEIHYDLTGELCQKGKNCLPNCGCGRFIEIWNLVFNEYYQDKERKLTPLTQKGVDTGMGFERVFAILQNKKSMYETELFWPIIQEAQRLSSKEYEEAKRSFRIIADHVRASVFLISDGVLPSNVEQGYILRRILRRAIRYGKVLEMKSGSLIVFTKRVIEIYKGPYPEVCSKQADILTIIQKEEEKFVKTLKKGLNQFNKLLEYKRSVSAKVSAKTKVSARKEGPRDKWADKQDTKCQRISGEEAFGLYQSYGFPLELIKEMAQEKGLTVDEVGFKSAFEKHRQVSKKGVEKKFGGIGKEATYDAIKLHTATHLLHQALREALGEHVRQMGSDIISQRLRFDFSHPQKMTVEEVKCVEEIVNQRIKEGLEVKREEMSLKEALNSGALAFFKMKYPQKVTVYSINDASGKVFSKEICAGLHVQRTSELGRFRIKKEESLASGVRRIRAILEKED